MAAEGTLVKGVIQVLKLVIPVVAKTVGFSWSLKNDLKKLQETLEMIHAKIADAEEKKDKSHELRLWLKRLKNVAYDADDVMDEFSYETMRLSERQSFMCKCLDFVSSSNPLAYRRKLKKNIKEVNKRLDEIAKDMGRFQLQTTFDITNFSHGESIEQRRVTASLVIDSEIVGRKDDKNKMVDILTKANTSTSSLSASSSSNANYHSSEKVSVISIVGMGGVGKTTLAQIVYNDEVVIKHFDQRLWVCVSTDFDVENILIKIMESITGAKFDNPSNFDVLVNKVGETLQRKKYLLVLDDLWNEDFQQWESLKSPLLAGAQGSKILITTRNMQVADVVKGDIPPYNLDVLQEDECWSIMEKRAFSPGGALKTPNMINIGKEMAKKCSGLPLAAKFLGSLMHSRNKESDWLSIRETDLWNAQQSQSAIRPILKLSYDNLSPYLKQCFSFCIILPKGSDIKRENLIHLWMAEGFLGPSSNVGDERSIEDIGEEYFYSLVWSSFLDVVEKNEWDDIITCKMHDLVHDLAGDIAESRDTPIVKISELENISDIRHSFLRLNNDDLSARRSKALSEMKKLRTLMVHGPNYGLEDYSFSSNKKLRVLHLGRVADDHPGGITYPAANKLKHLRYFYVSNLDLINCDMHGQSISMLYHLQTLVLSECSNVHILLDNMGSLKNLRYLDISFTDIKRLPESVTGLPDLQKLDLSHCKSLTTFPTSVTGLQQLKNLNMCFTPIEELPGFIINLHNLQILEVIGCENLKSLPEYVEGLSNLRVFGFGGCPFLEALPKDIGKLTQLRSLDVLGTAIRVLPEECSKLHNLEYVNLFECEGIVQVTNWTKLRKFYFKRNMVTPKDIGKLVFLQELTYRVRDQVVNEQDECNDDGIEELASLRSLEGLAIRDLQNVIDPRDAKRANLNGKQNLRHLELYWFPDEIEEEMMIWDHKWCSHLQVFEALQPPTGLEYLRIHNFMGSDLPTWMCVPSGFPELFCLELRNCKGIKELLYWPLPRLALLHILEMESLKRLDIGGFPSLIYLYVNDTFVLEELSCSYPSSSCLQILKIDGCKILTKIPSFPYLTELVLERVNHKLVWAVGRSQISSLAKLYLKKIIGLVYFPLSILQNNLGLQLLHIKECNQLHGIREYEDRENANEYYRIAALQELCFLDCPVLNFIPDVRGWSSSLETLIILKCPHVKESLDYDLKSLSFLKDLEIDFDQDLFDPSDMYEIMRLAGITLTFPGQLEDPYEIMRLAGITGGRII